ncbi:hypothetical protein RUND412_006623 [Rhizina undulata]
MLQKFIEAHAIQLAMILELKSKVPPEDNYPLTYQNDPALVKKVATLTTKVADLKVKIVDLEHKQSLMAAPTTPPLLKRLNATSAPLSWAQVISKKTKKMSTITMASKPAPTPASLSKHDRTIIIIRDTTPVPTTITPLTIHNTVNKALDKSLIAKVYFTTSHNVQLIAITTTSTNTILKFCIKLEKVICFTILSSTNICKDAQIYQVIIYSIPITFPSAKESFAQVKAKVKQYNPGTSLLYLHHWLLKPD